MGVGLLMTVRLSCITRHFTHQRSFSERRTGLPHTWVILSQPLNLAIPLWMGILSIGDGLTAVAAREGNGEFYAALSSA